ncbi:hypothetical protein [Deefgea sp. CFH1-16]|uniref:hypothetical protein n=1 Tax=Deefgea sp. CFH1-16 TaxID=2675457 RepID=UPI0015F3EFCF|nr:hypothetical protein [Deefgea sp. CFH1-16]MBM5575591.1 hypothetical protein [Deefgea sp. CFH1-16]
MDQKKWIGVDLDGTLAKSNKGARNNTIGEPIEAMLNRIKKWIEDGEYEVRIFYCACQRQQADFWYSEMAR